MTPLMTGKLVFRVDDNQADLVTYVDAPFYRTKKTGTISADLEITIDLDALRTQLVNYALRTGDCRLTRINKAIVVEPVKDSVKIHGTGTPQ